MASITKRGNGYRITVSNGYDICGKKIVETATWVPEPGMKKREMELALNAFAVDFEREVRSGKNIKGARMTLLELSRAYLKDMTPPTLARTTYADYKKRLELRILPAMGHIQIENIRQKDINNYKKMLEETYISPATQKPLSAASIKKDCLVVSAMLSYAVSEGFLDLNMLIYSGKISGRKTAKKEIKPKYFTIEELIRFMDALECPIDVLHQEHSSKRNGLKMGDNWKGYHGKDYNKNFIFTQAYGKQMHICSPAGEFKRIIRMYNQYAAKSPEERIPEGISPHGLRHSAAAILISNNIDARTVAGILGHADPTTTLNIYSYFFKSKGAEASAIMEQQLLSRVVTK